MLTPALLLKLTSHNANVGILGLSRLPTVTDTPRIVGWVPQSGTHR